MRGLVFLTAIGVAVAAVNAASAQMCGGGQTTQAQATSAGMCGMMGAAPAPAAGQNGQSQSAGGCSCCQRMAMMQAPAGGQSMMGGGMMGGQGTAGQRDQDTTPNMQMPAPGGPLDPAPAMPKP